MIIRDIRRQWRSRPAGHRTFLAMKHPNYRLWFWGQMTSLFGSWMQSAALGFLIFELTKSPAFLGLTGFANGVPTWLFMLTGGVVADRLPRRRVMIVTQTAEMILAFIVSTLVFTGAIRPWNIIVLAFAMGTANAFDTPARQALVQDLVPLEDMTNAIALNSAMFNLSVAFGPTFGGLIYALVGPGWCFLVNGLSFVAVILALAKMKLPVFIPPSRAFSLVADLREGLGYAGREPVIRTIMGLVFVISLFGFSFMTLIPAWTVNILHGNATTNGLLLSSRGVGSLLAALFIASLGRFRFRGRLLTLGSLAFPLLMILFSFVRGTAASCLVIFVSGFAIILVFNMANATIQSITPDRLRGRVMAIYGFVFFGSVPLGSLMLGTIAERIGEPPALVSGSLFVLFFALLAWIFMPRLRAVE